MLLHCGAVRQPGEFVVLHAVQQMLALEAMATQAVHGSHDTEARKRTAQAGGDNEQGARKPGGYAAGVRERVCDEERSHPLHKYGRCRDPVELGQLDQPSANGAPAPEQSKVEVARSYGPELAPAARDAACVVVPHTDGLSALQTKSAGVVASSDERARGQALRDVRVSVRAVGTAVWGAMAALLTGELSTIEVFVET